MVLIFIENYMESRKYSYFVSCKIIISPWHASPFDSIISSIIIDLIVAFFPAIRNILLIGIPPFDSLLMNLLLLSPSFLSIFKLVLKVRKWFLQQFCFQCCLRNRSGLQSFALNDFLKVFANKACLKTYFLNIAFSAIFCLDRFIIFIVRYFGVLF